jgi:hypothetical protein
VPQRTREREKRIDQIRKLIQSIDVYGITIRRFCLQVAESEGPLLRLTPLSLPPVLSLLPALLSAQPSWSPTQAYPSCADEVIACDKIPEGRVEKAKTPACRVGRSRLIFTVQHVFEFFSPYL